MARLPLAILGAHELPGTKVSFGILLPFVDQTFDVRVRIVHEDDALLQAVTPATVPMTHSKDPTYGDLWQATVDITATGRGPSWGNLGTYIYWYEIHNPNNGRVADRVIDPFAREFGTGRLAAITLGYSDAPWSAGERVFKVPNVEDLIVYELNVHEFADDLAGVAAKLPYLKDLGINCIELMPVTNAERTVEWGYMPRAYFGLHDRLGNRNSFRALVDRAHCLGIAVIVDCIYGHTSSQFCYSQAYRDLGMANNPFLGSFAKDMFGESIDYGKALARDYVIDVNEMWLEKFHIDGFRLDCVPNYHLWRDPTDCGYAKLVYDTYQLVKANLGQWPRFDGNGRINLIQCGEDLDDPAQLLYDTYSSGSWQNQTLKCAYDVAQGGPDAITAFGHRIAAIGYPETKVHADDTIAQRCFQYINCHDASHFVAQFGVVPSAEALFLRADRSQWFKEQPYLIASLLSKGVPMLWQGSELADDYCLPPTGSGRVYLERPVHWNYWNDEPGSRTLSLVRKLLGLRKGNALFRAGRVDFWDDAHNYQNAGLLVFSCSADPHFALVAVNFTDNDVAPWLVFPSPGVYQEQLHGLDNVTTTSDNEWRQLTIPSHYGRVWLA